MKKSMKNRVAGAAAVLLAGSMAFSMTGCGSSSDNTAGQQTATDQKTEGNEEYTKIVYAFKSFNNIPEDLSDVNEAISEITREKIGVEVELMPIASSAYGQQVSLAMQGGEQLDLFHTGSGLELSTCLANHQLYDITDIVKEHAAGAIDAVGEDFMKTEVVDGKVYGIPADKGVALAPTLLYREDIMEEIGVDPADIKNINDLTDVYAKVKEAYPDMIPLVPVNPGDSGMINTIYGFDYLGDRYLSPTGILNGDDMQVENFYETDGFKDILTLARDWYNKGYIYFKNSEYLKHWFEICPRKQFTTLDTHDGIGVVDVRGLLPDEEIEAAKEHLFEYGANVKRVYNTEKYNNLDIYQINCTYYSALGDDDNAYLLARAIQFFAPGTPQVYYVGLLAGKNDISLLEETKEGRNINRHYYTEEEIGREVERPVVKQLLELMKLRNTHPAFDGEFYMLPCEKEQLILGWKNGDSRIELHGDLGKKSFEII